MPRTAKKSGAIKTSTVKRARSARRSAESMAKTTESIMVRTAGMNQLANVLLGLVVVALVANIAMIVN